MAYTADPITWDHQLRIGDTYQPAVITLADSTGTAYSLSGATGEASIKTEPGGTVVATPTVTVTSASAGQFTWVVSAATTAALAPGTYRYAVRLTFASGEKRTIIEGRVTATRGAL